MIVVPGTKATVADLAWMRERGLAQAIRRSRRPGRAVLGICGGFQMLCRRIDDTVESRSGGVEAMGMLDADIVFAPDKVLRRRQPTAARLRDPPRAGGPLLGGQLVRAWTDPRRVISAARVFGTHWHGLFDNDDFRRQWLTLAAAAAGRDGFIVADDVDVAARRDAQLDLMADLLDAHLDVDAIAGLLDTGPPPRPTIVSALRRPQRLSVIGSMLPEHF